LNPSTDLLQAQAAEETSIKECRSGQSVAERRLGRLVDVDAALLIVRLLAVSSSRSGSRVYWRCFDQERFRAGATSDLIDISLLSCAAGISTETEFHYPRSPSGAKMQSLPPE
jgi:hypothetical protein